MPNLKPYYKGKLTLIHYKFVGEGNYYEVKKNTSVDY